MFSIRTFEPVRFFKALFVVFAAAVALSGCATRDPRLVEAIKGTRVADVRVESTPDVGTGLPMINGKTPEQQVAIVVAALQKVASRDLKGYPGGATPARLVITLQTADLASEQGRVLLGSEAISPARFGWRASRPVNLLPRTHALPARTRVLRGRGWA
jgi:hypothetical protein